MADANSIVDSIRQSQSIAMEKLASVKLALDERRLQLQQLINNDTRPKTAFLRTPAHIRALYESVCETAVELRQRLITVHPELSRSISSGEMSQLSALLGDLERELTAMSRRLDLVYKRTSPAPLLAKHEPLPLLTTPDASKVELTSFPPPSRLPPIHVERFSKRTRAMLLRHHMTSLRRDSTDSYQCYPRGSSFPKLKPIPSRYTAGPRQSATVNEEPDISTDLDQIATADDKVKSTEIRLAAGRRSDWEARTVNH